MTDVLEFNDIAQEVKGAMNGGRLKLSKQGVAFKNNKTGKVDQVHAEDMEKTNWLKVARGYELKLYTTNGSIFKYDGFKDADQERVGKFIKNNFDLELEEKEMSYKGWNWGTASFAGSELQFAVDKKASFHLPLGNVSHSTTAKNEVILEFHQNDDAEVSLMEMRFYVPPTETDANPVEAFHEKILAKADIIQATGDALCSIEQIPCLTPRGRYDIKLFPTFLQLHGKTFDYKISYTTVLRLFLLPHKDNRQMYFVLSLDPPIVQGLTRYHFLILSFNKEDTLTLELNVSDEDLEGKYQGKLQREMTGASFEIISRLLKSLTGRKITIPGSFNALGGTKSINCSHKSNSGFLYPLERGFMYVHKPPIHIRFDEIACVNFSRGTGSTTRYFDFEIEVRNGSVFVFSSIDKNEYSHLFDFVSGKKLRVKNRGMKSAKDGAINYDELMDSDDEGDHDAYLEQMKQEGKEKDEEDEDYQMNDDSDESDEDFDPDVGEASDVELEYDSNASESSDSDEDYTAGDDGSEVEEGELKRKKHKESKKRKVRTVSERPRKPRKKKKKDEDPNKPKRAPSAYMMWLNENREKIKKDMPDQGSVTDIAKKAGEIWNNLETEEKANWQDKASEAKREYQKAMMEYNKRKEEEGGEEEGEEEEPGTPKKKDKKKKKKKSSPSPKKSTAGSGTNYKSKEYIESSESSSDDDKSKSKGKKSEKKEKKEVKKEESEKEESEKEESEKEESEKEESEKEASEAENEESGSEAGSD